MNVANPGGSDLQEKRHNPCDCKANIIGSLPDYVAVYSTKDRYPKEFKKSSQVLDWNEYFQRHCEPVQIFLIAI